MKIPSFSEVIDAVKEGNPTPLHLFIYHHEPIKHISPNWRQQFTDMVNYLCTETYQGTDTSITENQNPNKHE